MVNFSIILVAPFRSSLGSSRELQSVKRQLEIAEKSMPLDFGDIPSANTVVNTSKLALDFSHNDTAIRTEELYEKYPPAFCCTTTQL